MVNVVKAFWNEEDGFGVVELVIIIGILVALALVFREALFTFVQDLMDKFFDSGKVESGVNG